MNWILDIFNGGMKKQAELANQETEFERKVEANDWIKETMNTPEDEPEIVVEAAYEAGDTSADTIKKDYKLALSGMSDYNLAEMLADLKCSADLLATLDFNEEKEKILKTVKSNRSSVESKILSLLGEHTSVDWKEAFKKFEDVDHVEPSEADLYDKLPSGKWRKKTKFEPVSDKEKVKQMEGVGKEEEKGALAKDAALEKKAVLKPINEIQTADEARQIAIEWQHEQSQANPSYGDLAQADEYFAQLVAKFPELTEELSENGIHSSKKETIAKKAFHIGDKVYYHGHPATIKDMTLNPHALEVSVAIEVDGEELHISGKELKEIGDEPLMEDLEHPAEVAPVVAPEPEIEKLPDVDVLPGATDMPAMAKKEAAGEPIPATPNPEEAPAPAVPGEAPITEEADLDKDAAANKGVVEAFVNKGDIKTKSSNLYMRQGKDGVDLINYQTVIAKNMGDKIAVSDKKYSVTTTKIQSQIQYMASAAGIPVVSMETGQPIDNEKPREDADFRRLDYGDKSYERLSSKDTKDEIESKASKADVISKFSMLSRHAEIESPWRVIKNDKGEDIVARTAPTLREKKSKNKITKVDIHSQENI